MARHARPTVVIPLLAAVVSLVAVPAVSVAAPAGVTVQRIFGADRYATSAAVARATFGASPTSVQKAVIASGTDFPDAVIGANVQSGYYGTGPILLTRKHEVPTPIVDVIKSLAIPALWVVGGTAAVDRTAEQQLMSLTTAFGLRGQLTRYSGLDRYTTGASVAMTAFDGEANLPAVVDGMRTAFLVSGVAANDGLAVAPLAYALFGSPLQTKFPLLLTQPDVLSTATSKALLSMTGGNRPIQQVIVIGGPGAVSEVVLSQIRALGLTARRIDGDSRQSTAVAVAEFAIQTLGWNPAGVVLARGDYPIDAASASPFAGEKQSPLLFTSTPDQLGAATADFLRAHAGTIQSIYVLGGPGAVSDAVIAQARAALGG